jgi:hypothetical protein
MGFGAAAGRRSGHFLTTPQNNISTFGMPLDVPVRDGDRGTMRPKQLDVHQGRMARQRLAIVQAAPLV